MNATRNDLLGAASRIVLRDGADRLTLDAVALEAGRSKGGVLYHFPSKEALITGMLDACLDGFEAEIELLRAELGGGPRSWLRAYLLASSDPQGQAMIASGGVFAAIAHQPELLRVMRERWIVWQQRADADGVDPTVASIVRLATDGLWLVDALALAPLQGERREAFINALQDMIDEGLA